MNVARDGATPGHAMRRALRLVTRWKVSLPVYVVSVALMLAAGPTNSLTAWITWWTGFAIFAVALLLTVIDSQIRFWSQPRFGRVARARIRQRSSILEQRRQARLRRRG